MQADALGFESDESTNPAKRFVGRSDSFELVSFGSDAMPRRKPDPSDALMFAGVVALKLNDAAEVLVNASASGALRLPLLVP